MTIHTNLIRKKPVRCQLEENRDFVTEVLIFLTISDHLLTRRFVRPGKEQSILIIGSQVWEGT
jgi:hypothetical protein